MNWFIVSRPNSTGMARSRTASSNSLVPTRAAKALKPSPSLALGLVHADPALDGLGHALGGQAHLQAGAVDDLAALVVAADVRDVGRDRVLADLDRRAVEPDVADVVLAAAVRAAGHLDVDPARQRVGDVHRLDPLAHRAVEPHRARDAELAGVGAGARDDVVDLVGAGLAEAELVQPRPDVVDRLVAHPAQHEVLVHGGARVAAGVVAHDRRRGRGTARARGRRAGP